MPLPRNVMFRLLPTLLLLVAGLLSPVLSAPLEAQSCFRGRPLPDCPSFWITEFGLSFRMNDPVPTRDAATATLEVGHAWNRSQNIALGGAVFFRIGDDLTGIGIRPRYHHWLGRHAAFDVSPGIRFSNIDSNFRADFSGQVGLSLHEFGLVLQMDTARTPDLSPPATADETELLWHLGGRVGDWFGATGIVGLLVLGVAFAAGGGAS